MPPLRLHEGCSDVRSDDWLRRCQPAFSAYIAGVFWLVFDSPRGVCVVLQPGPSLIHARLVANLNGTADFTFTEGHQLDAKTVKKIPKDMIGKCLSSKQAQQLLKRLATR